jgi:hypothetical protein
MIHTSRRWRALGFGLDGGQVRSCDIGADQQGTLAHAMCPCGQSDEPTYLSRAKAGRGWNPPTRSLRVGADLERFYRWLTAIGERGYFEAASDTETRSPVRAAVRR